MTEKPASPDIIESLPPIIGICPRLIILGSMPGPESLRLQQYYAHPQNAFWHIISALMGVETPTDYPGRRALIESRPLILWDVLARCRREGALDAKIKEAAPNDLAAIISAHPSLKLAALNGGKAAAEFARLKLPLAAVRLPSTSPAHAALSREEKLERWRDAVGEYFS